MEITEKDNEGFVRNSSEAELRMTLFSIPNDSSCRLDRFGLGFYIACWDFVKGDLLDATKEFFKCVLFRFFTSFYVILIPMVKEPNSFGKFRPISLCSVAYKIFSKIIIKILTQGDFPLGRIKFKNVTLAQEMVHFINRKSNGGNLVL